MSDDPRGHDDGDLIVGSPEDNPTARDDALDFQFKGFLGSIAAEGGHSPDNLIAGCRRAIDWLRECKAKGEASMAKDRR